MPPTTSNITSLNTYKTEFILMRDEFKKMSDPSVALKIESAAIQTLAITSTVR